MMANTVSRIQSFEETISAQHVPSNRWKTCTPGVHPGQEMYSLIIIIHFNTFDHQNGFLVFWCILIHPKCLAIFLSPWYLLPCHLRLHLGMFLSRPRQPHCGSSSTCSVKTGGYIDDLYLSRGGGTPGYCIRVYIYIIYRCRRIYIYILSILAFWFLHLAPSGWFSLSSEFKFTSVFRHLSFFSPLPMLLHIRLRFFKQQSEVWADTHVFLSQT